MWTDKRAIFQPSMKRRNAVLRFFPPTSWAVLIGTGLVLAIFGDKMLRAFFWLIACCGRLIVNSMMGQHL